MKKISLFSITIFIFALVVNKGYAQISKQQQDSTTVSAQVVQAPNNKTVFNLNLSGFITPLANIQLLINNFPIRAITADQNGNFYFTAVQIQSGLDKFCFDAFDPKKVGESYTCLNISPANADVTLNNIFLPPTMALERSQITYGDQVVVQGYTMPFASVLVHLNTGQIVTAKADKAGYYNIAVKNLKPGTYDLYTTATYNNQDSLKSTKTLTVVVLTAAQSITNKAGATFFQVVNVVTNPFIQSPLGPLWATIPLLIVISLLLKQAYPGLLLKAISAFPLALLHKREKRLHHYWFVGY